MTDSHGRSSEIRDRLPVIEGEFVVSGFDEFIVTCDAGSSA
jgi:hypothetical protein